MNVVVSILPLAEFVEKIGGDRVAVTVMVPPGASPHNYEPTPQQLRQVSEARMYVKLGAPIEFEIMMLDKLIALNPNMTVVNAGAGIILRSNDNHDHDNDHHHGHGSGHDHHTGSDPHTWLSVRNALIMIDNIYGGLSSIDPARGESYTANYQQYRGILESLDHELTTDLTSKKQRRFIVYHPAWGYFADDYGLEQIAVEIKGKEPPAQAISKLIKRAKDGDIKIIFASPQFSAKGAEIIARSIGGQVVFIDPLAKDYVLNLKTIGRAFAESME